MTAMSALPYIRMMPEGTYTCLMYIPATLCAVYILSINIHDFYSFL